MKKIKIMFVCHGNICRSPSAEYVMKKLVADKGLKDMFEIASSATSGDEIFAGRGNPVYPPARRELMKHGIDCGDKRAVRLRGDDYDKYDLFIGMDNANIKNMVFLFDGDKNNKVSKLMSYTGIQSDVSDPWYSGNFEKAYDDIYRGCTALLEHLIKF